MKSQVPPEILEKAAEEEANRINVTKDKMVKRLGEEGVSREEALQAAEEATQEDRVSPHLEDEDDPLMNDAPVDLGKWWWCKASHILSIGVDSLNYT